jgi:hypothetical protein
VKLTRRRTVVAVASAAALTTGFGVAGSIDASAATKVHTLKFVAISGPEINPTQTTFLSTDVEKSHGKVVGFDTISGRFSFKTHHVRIFVALSRKDGLLYATLNGSGDSNVLNGRVTGGAGVYKGATGRVHTHSPAQNSNRTYVTVRYHF